MRAGRIGHKSLVSVTQDFRDPLICNFACSQNIANPSDSPRKVSSHFALPRTCVTKNSTEVLFFVYAVRAGRIGLPSTPWQGVVIPLNYARRNV